SENLHLDMPGLFDVFFQVERAVLESLLGLLPGGCDSGAQADVVAGHTHATAAPPCRRLDQDRKADLVSKRQCLAIVFNQALASGYNRYVDFLGKFAGLILVAQAAHGILGWADELNVARTADLGKVCILRQKAVAGVNGLDVGDLGGTDNARNIEIAL